MFHVTGCPSRDHSTDHQGPSSRILRGDRLENVRCDVLREQTRQRLAVRHAVTRKAGEQAARSKYVVLADGGGDTANDIVVSRPEKSERRNQRARADAGDDFEFRSGPLCAPPSQKARGERTSVATA